MTLMARATHPCKREGCLPGYPVKRRPWSRVALDLDAPGLSRDVAADLVNRAHETCPYSRATRANIAVTLTIGGSSIERQAA
jgi:hypothetical protein